MARFGLYGGDFVLGGLSDGCGFLPRADHFVLKLECHEGVHSDLNKSLVRRSVNQILLMTVHDVQLIIHVPTAAGLRTIADVEVHLIFVDSRAIGRGRAGDLPDFIR